LDKKQGPVLQSLRDMEGLFEFGGEISPFLEELFAFLRDLMPIIAKAKFSLMDTTQAMPGATDNISSAESMAESATHSIMDSMESIGSDIEALAQKDLDDDSQALITNLSDKINDIAIALQFQDITAQHLQQANQIVAAIQSRMDKLFGALTLVGEENKIVKSILENYALSDEEEIDTTDQIRQDSSISQDDIDALFG
jgi:chemotaxis regulatin CheY-phosphate phosphatase CheZ